MIKAFPLIALLMISFSYSQNGPDYSTPEKTYSTYISALRNNDSLAVWRCWDPEEFRFHTTREFALQPFKIVGTTVFDSSEVTSRSYGSIGDVELRVERINGKYKYIELVFLEKVNNKWKITTIFD